MDPYGDPGPGGDPDADPDKNSSPPKESDGEVNADLPHLSGPVPTFDDPGAWRRPRRNWLRNVADDGIDQGGPYWTDPEDRDPERLDTDTVHTYCRSLRAGEWVKINRRPIPYEVANRRRGPHGKQTILTLAPAIGPAMDADADLEDGDHYDGVQALRLHVPDSNTRAPPAVYPYTVPDDDGTEGEGRSEPVGPVGPETRSVLWIATRDVAADDPAIVSDVSGTEFIRALSSSGKGSQ